MKHSIRIKLAVIVTGLISGAICICILLNFLFLDKYYQNVKQGDLINAFRTVSLMSERSEKLTEKDAAKLTQLCESKGITLLIADPSIEKTYVYGDSTDSLTQRLNDIIFNEEEALKGSSVVRRTDDYTLLYLHNAESIDYFELSAVLDSNSFVLMRVSLENVTGLAGMANMFFAFVGCGVIIMSVIIVSAVAYKISVRVLRLVNISERMAHMDFDARYEGYLSDEIDVLGFNMNKLSSELKKNITDLKVANIKLQKDIQEKNEIDEMRKEFLSNVSHELKTPLAIIQGYAEGLKESVNDDPESRDFYCDVIMDEANKMNNMVKQLLSLNQLESGGTSLNLEKFNLTEVLNQRLNATAILIEQKEATVIFKAEKDYYVWADEFKIEEVITNYLSNALNHLDYEKVIKITIEEFEKTVRVTIFNSGNPIPDADIESIWDKFYKVDKARTREYGGSGIGLSIVKAIMNSMNQGYGAMNVSGGVAFWFEVEKAEEM